MSAVEPARGLRPQLIVHVLYRFAVGGLENGVVNLLNSLSPARWRHAVVSLTQVSQAFRQRVQRDDVVYVSLEKSPGHLIRLYPQLFKLFRDLQPAIVHTRNLAALEAQLPAWSARAPVRIHSEHGWDVTDLSGANGRYRLARRLYRPFVQQYVALSGDLKRYLVDQIHVPESRIEQVCNGVDAARFRPSPNGRRPIAGSPFNDPRLWLIGTVGRLERVKDQLNLARAFVRVLQLCPNAAEDMRLIVVGDGPLREPVLELLTAAECSSLVWLAGERADIPEILQGLDLFVLPSLAEGISNTILEAMASGLAVLATDVGGNRELVEHQVTGQLVPAADSERLAQAIVAFYRDRNGARQQGRAGRQRVEQRFSLDQMVVRYDRLYERMARARGIALAQPCASAPRRAPAGEQLERR